MKITNRLKHVLQSLNRQSEMFTRGASGAGGTGYNRRNKPYLDQSPRAVTPKAWRK